MLMQDKDNEKILFHKIEVLTTTVAALAKSVSSLDTSVNLQLISIKESFGKDIKSVNDDVKQLKQYSREHYENNTKRLKEIGDINVKIAKLETVDNQQQRSKGDTFTRISIGLVIVGIIFNIIQGFGG
jgi:phage host-nuclease inhibitor protein Gam